MPPPKTRAELTSKFESAFEKLSAELRDRDATFGALPAVDGWTIRDLLAVRLWWSERVVEWIEAGKRGEIPELPAAGYPWNETPRLNQSVVTESADVSFDSIRTRLDAAVERVRSTIDALTDAELFETGVFPWADRWAVSRWIAINTTRQYTTARTTIRRAARNLEE